jgi:hypothetical protein
MAGIKVGYLPHRATACLVPFLNRELAANGGRREMYAAILCDASGVDSGALACMLTLQPPCHFACRALTQGGQWHLMASFTLGTQL